MVGYVFRGALEDIMRLYPYRWAASVTHRFSIARLYPCSTVQLEKKESINQDEHDGQPR